MEQVVNNRSAVIDDNSGRDSVRYKNDQQLNEVHSVDERFIF